jgi:AcrR family transcriptional regulator
MELFQERGYVRTTVEEIAARAGLTERTFFRYFADKREVLFSGSKELEKSIVDGIEGAPREASPLAAVVAAFEAAGAETAVTSASCVQGTRSSSIMPRSKSASSSSSPRSRWPSRRRFMREVSPILPQAWQPKWASPSSRSALNAGSTRGSRATSQRTSARRWTRSRPSLPKRADRPSAQRRSQRAGLRHRDGCQGRHSRLVGGRWDCRWASGDGA